MQADNVPAPNCPGNQSKSDRDHNRDLTINKVARRDAWKEREPRGDKPHPEEKDAEKDTLDNCLDHVHCFHDVR